MRPLIAAVSLLLPLTLGTSGVEGGLSPVLEYSFPASYDGDASSESDVITDLSAAGNHGVMDTMDRALIDNRPAGFDASLMSISGSNGNHGATNGIDLLDNALIEAAGGFTMDVWFQWEGTYTNIRKQIDYAGTEALRTNDSEIQFILSNSAFVIGAPIVAETWYHAVATFNTGGNSVYDGAYEDAPDIDGTMSLYLDDVLVGSQAATKTGFGDSLNRPIGINRWAGGQGDHNQGIIFNPTVSLGIIPEPSTIVLGAMLIGFCGLGSRPKRTLV